MKCFFDRENIKKLTSKVAYLWQFFFLCSPDCPKQPRTSFPFYKLFYPIISGRISEETPFLKFCKLWSFLNRDSPVVHKCQKLGSYWCKWIWRGSKNGFCLNCLFIHELEGVQYINICIFNRLVWTMKMSRKLPLKRSKWAKTAKNISFQDGEKNVYKKQHVWACKYVHGNILHLQHGICSDAKIEICMLTLFKTSCWECLFVQHFIGQK